MNIQPAAPLDIFVWPDGTWCFREDVCPCQQASGDHRVLPHGSTEAEDFLVQEYTA